ncbi:MAG: hypothetical protein ACQEQ4_04460 [Fibrobacterota bacterium]
MLKKVKNRHRVLLLSTDTEVTNDILMLLSAHYYLVDLAKDEARARDLFVNYKHSILIADVDLIPDTPQSFIPLFKAARKKPVFLLINRNERSDKVLSYLQNGVDDLLTMPIYSDKLYRKVKRAAEYNRMQHDIEYHSGMVFLLKMLIPVIIVITFLLSL